MRAVLYARVSTQEQAREDATSIESQLQRAQSYADAQGWEVTASYADEGVSGALSLSDRPQGRHLLEADYDVAVFWAMDRFTRSAMRGLADLERLEGAGRSVVFVKEAIDTSTPSGRLFRTMLAAFAEFERETILERNMGGRYAKAVRGDWPSGRPIYGYRFVDGHLQPDPDEAPHVQTAFRLRATGLTYGAVARALRAAGARPRHSHVRLQASHVRHMIQRPEYRGAPLILRLRATATSAPDAFEYPCPALVDDLTWRAANGHPPDPRSERKNAYALLGRVTHDATRCYGKERRYRCPDGPTCPGLGTTPNGRKATSISADDLEAAIGFALLRALQTLPGAPNDPEGLPIPENDVAARREALRALREQKSRWLEMYAEGLIDRQARDDHLEAIDAAQADLEARPEPQTTPLELINLESQLDPPGGGGPPEPDPHAHDVPRWTPQWAYELEAALHQRPLPPWAILELAHLASTLDVQVRLHTPDDPTRGPGVEVTYDMLNEQRFWRGCSWGRSGSQKA